MCIFPSKKWLLTDNLGGSGASGDAKYICNKL
jgi:hypothetical protein